MKLKSLHIDSYRHLENLHFDFTYPDGHAKAGQPLEKICIIGQSATGKTSLLELVKDSFLKLNSLETVDDKYLIDHPNHFYEFNHNIHFQALIDDELISLSKSAVQKNDKIYAYENQGGSLNKLIKGSIKLAYITSDILSQKNINILKENPLLLSEYLNTPQNSNFHFSNNFIYEFSDQISDAIWNNLLKDNLEYRTKFTQKVHELMAKGVIVDVNKFNKAFETWSKENKNPLIALSNKFSSILSKLNLEIDLISTEYFIPIKSLINDEVIPVSSLSTGTKALLLSGLPLFKLDTKDSIVLIDEPERSLFPDVQIDLMSHYQNLAPDAQFVVATHSPFIAAAFEPEERFILYFDEKGKVAVRRGESPIGDDPNDILYNDFKVDYYNEFGKKAYKEYRDLKTKAYAETDTKKKNDLILEITKIGDKYNF